MVKRLGALSMFPFLCLLTSAEQPKATVRQVQEEYEALVGARVLFVSAAENEKFPGLHDAVEAAARASLARYGIPTFDERSTEDQIAEVARTNSAAEMAWLLLVVDGVQPSFRDGANLDLHVTEVTLSFCRQGFFRVDDSGKVVHLSNLLRVWEKNIYTHGPTAQRSAQVRDAVVTLVDRFVVDYFKANPKK